jgi:hypothetical protein
MRGLLRRLKCDNYKRSLLLLIIALSGPDGMMRIHSATIIQIDLSIFMKFQRAVG